MKQNKSKIAAIAIGTLAVVGSMAFVGGKEKTYNSILDGGKAPVVQTNYAPSVSGGPVDFQKAAENAVPSVVHIRTVVKFKETAGRQNRQANPFGDFFGNDEMFKRFFGEGGGSFQQPEQKHLVQVLSSATMGISLPTIVVDGATEVTVTLNDRKLQS